MTKQKTNKNDTLTPIEQAEKNEAVASNIGQDLKNSVLIVSLVLNMIVFTFWLTLQVTSQYNDELSLFIFG